MGSISAFNLPKIINKYGIEVFVETGIFHGAGIKHALKFPFKKVISIDIMPKYYEKALVEFHQEDRVALYLGDSKSVLPNKVLKELGPEPVLWWLDAHLEIHEDPYPLEAELNIIKAAREISGDVFVMDDLRVYKKGNFQNGNFEDPNWPDSGGDKFFYDILGPTHALVEHYKDEGYMVAYPKKK